MNSTALQRILMPGTLVPFSAGRIEQTAIVLRKAGLLQTGGRGLNAADLSAIEVMRIVVGLASPTVEGAVEFVKRREGIGELTKPHKFPRCRGFAEALAAAIADPDGKLGIDRCIVNQDWPEATIVFDDRSETKFGMRLKTIRPRGFAMYREAVFGSGLFHQLAINLVEENSGPDDEWAA